MYRDGSGGGGECGRRKVNVEGGVSLEVYIICPVPSKPELLIPSVLECIGYAGYLNFELKFWILDEWGGVRLKRNGLVITL